MPLIEQYRLLHEKGIWFRGTAIKGHIEDIGRVICETGAVTILDYGCGKALYYREKKIHESWRVPLPYLYDPAVPEYSAKPAGQFDGVICTDVLEHVEDPQAVLAELVGHARKFLYLTISCRESPPGKRLPDGRPFHICVHPPQWWRERIAVPASVRLELRFDIEASQRRLAS